MLVNKRWWILKEQSINPEKLATLGTQDEGKQNKNKYLLDFTTGKQTHKMCALLQTNEGKEEQNIDFMRKS
jgi:hypothetical protein